MDFDLVNFQNRRMDKFIGLAIKQLRVNAQLTQEKLADRLHSSASRISNIERGSSTASIRLISDIASVLSVKVSSIFELVEQLQGAHSASINEVPPSYVLINQRLVKAFWRLSPRDQGIIEGVMGCMSPSEK
jgi:transcriptional regulator with XRE-family HTH domain